MELRRIDLIEYNNTYIAEVKSDGLCMSTVQDALDIMADCSNQGANKIIIHEKNMATEFFSLRTGLAGEILQKFSNYRVLLAIVGDFSKYMSKSLKDFIYESNKYRQVVFVGSVDEAKEKLAVK